jgi:hypothetical protein
MQKEVVVSYFNTLFQYTLEGTGKTDIFGM